MQFVVIAHDYKDDDALTRRLAARQGHLDYSDDAFKRGEQIIAAAMLNDHAEMCGSVMIVDFPNREALNAWLEKEAYVTGNVWEKIDIIECKVGASFLDK